MSEVRKQTESSKFENEVCRPEDETSDFRLRTSLTGGEGGLRRHSVDCLDDMARGDAEAGEQLFGVFPSRNLAHCESMDGEARVRHPPRDGLAQPAPPLVIFHRDQMG